MPCPKIARPMPPACGLRGRTDSRADIAWFEVRATGPDYPNAKATQANPQVSAEGVAQLDGSVFRRTDRPRRQNAASVCVPRFSASVRARRRPVCGRGGLPTHQGD